MNPYKALRMTRIIYIPKSRTCPGVAMAAPSVFVSAPGLAAGCQITAGVYQSGSSIEGAVFWLVLAIAVIMGFGLILYLFFVRGSYEREKQAALALIGARETGAAPRSEAYYRSAPSYSYRSDVPDAVAAAMSGLKDRAEADVELVDEGEDDRLPAHHYSGRRPAPGPRPEARLPAPRASDGRSDRPPREAWRAPPRRAASPLDDLLHAGERDGLREEDRELLREERLEPEPEAPGLSGEDEDVAFEDEPEPAPAVHPPAPYRIGRRERPMWERVLDGAPGPAGSSGAGPREEPPAGEAEVELIDMDEPAPAKPVLSKPVADMLFQQDIMKMVKVPPPGSASAPARRPPAQWAPARPGGPAWTEGRPVFSKPLEEPDGPTNGQIPPSSGLEDTLGEISHKLRSMDERAMPRLPPKAEAKMGLQEKKFLEAMRAVQEKKREEDRAREDEGHRLLEEQMQELERKKKEEEQKRLAEQRLSARQRLDRERGQQAKMGRWEQARQATQEKLRSDESARAVEQKAGQESARRENERRRKEAQAREDPSATIDEVLSRIGIKK